MPGREMSPPREEFSCAGAEFASHGKEIVTGGGEFEQKTAPEERKRKRRISPLMMTAAAVATAAVVVSGVGQRGRDYPEWKLTAAQCAYLDEVWTELREQDGARLAELSAQPMVEEIYREVLLPYAEMLEREYGEDVIHGEEEGEYVSCSLSYNGESISCEHGDGTKEFWLHYERNAYRETDGTIAYDNTYVNFDMYDYESWGLNEPEKSYYFWSHYDNLEQRISDWEVEYEEGRIQTAPDGVRHWLTEWGSSERWYLSWHHTADGQMDLPVKHISEGEIIEEWVEPEDGSDPYYERHLENGTVDCYVQVNGEWQHAGRIEVIDGVIQMNEQMKVEQNGEYYWITVTSEAALLPGYSPDEPYEPYTWNVAGGKAASAEEVLYHSDIYYW